MDTSWQPLTVEQWPFIAVRPVFSAEIPDQNLLNAKLNFVEAIESGWGPVISTGVRLSSGNVCALHRHRLSAHPLEWVAEFEDSDDIVSDVNEVLSQLRVEAEAVSWVSDRYKFPSFEVHRMDDNSNEFLVGVYRFEALARHKIERLAAGGHKQLYWLRAAPPSE